MRGRLELRRILGGPVLASVAGGCVHARSARLTSLVVRRWARSCTSCAARYERMSFPDDFSVARVAVSRFARAWRERPRPGSGVMTPDRAAVRSRHSRRRRAIVLGYHGVAESRRRDDLSMLLFAPDRFRAQLELLLARRISLRHARRFRDGGRRLGAPWPGSPRSPSTTACATTTRSPWPILAEYSIPPPCT